jgi:hypothetical protein
MKLKNKINQEKNIKKIAIKIMRIKLDIRIK